MAQVRFAAAIAAATLAMSTLVVTGCSMRNSGSSVANTESLEAVEIVSSAKSARYMSLFASAMDAIGWVVPLPFNMQGESTQDSLEEVRFSGVAVESVSEPPKYPL
jgi:hypothetical protein